MPASSRAASANLPASVDIGSEPDPPAGGPPPPPPASGDPPPLGAPLGAGEAAPGEPSEGRCDAPADAGGVYSGAVEAWGSSGSAVVGEGDMGTNSASPKREADLDASPSPFSLSSSSPASSFGVSGSASSLPS